MSAPREREPSSDPAARIGWTVGSYSVVRYIGKGGMGVVYEAVHDAIGQRAAVKFLSDDGALSSEYFRRFANEARAASAVQHPGLVKVFDFGRTPNGEPYLLMEYLEGEVLRARLQRLRALPFEMTMRIARQLASALAAVHARGIVHRDVKPENVIIVADDAAEGGERAKLLDFGIARFDWANATLTQPGVVLGTPMYMSPEQCIGGAAGPASDVYSLGLIVWEMLSGVTPFGMQGATAMLLQGVQSPYLRSADVPDAVALVIEKMLATDAGRRPSAPAVANEMDSRAERRSGSLSPMASTQAAPTPARGTTRSPSGLARRWGTVAVAAATVGIAAGVYAARLRHPAGAPPSLSSMIWFPGGAFTMGSTPDDVAAECARLGPQCRRDLLDREQPARNVTLSPFYLDEHEVKNADLPAWLNVAQVFTVEDDPETHELRYVKDKVTGAVLVDLSPDYSGIMALGGDRFVARPGYEQKPAVQVTWDGARAFCATRGKRLPTEAEWERAARGLTSRRYPWGDSEPTCDGVVFGRSAKGACNAKPAGVENVGTAPQDRTPEGVMGLGGNVSEWVEDAFTLPYYPECGDCQNPRVDAAREPSDLREPPKDLPRDLRVFRGAGWNTSLFLRSASRGRWNRAEPAFAIGFRCAANGQK